MHRGLSPVDGPGERRALNVRPPSPERSGA